MARKKKKTAAEREEQEQIIEPDSKGATEAEEQHNAIQTEAMADLLDGDDIKPEAAEDPAADLQTDEPPEKPAAKEQKSQPDKAEVPEPDKQAKAEDQLPSDIDEPKAADPDTSKPAEKPAADEPPAKKDEPKPAEFVSGDRFADFQVEVVTDEGAKSVPLGNLVTTYQQHGYLQKKYTEAKPLFDLVEKAGYKPMDTMPLLELGIQAYLKQQGIVEGNQPPVGATRSGETPPAGGYQGPFESQEQDDYYKEVDPDMHGTMHRLFKMASGGNDVTALRQEIETLKRAQSAPPAAGSEDAQRASEQAQKAFDDKILAWSGDHTDYFTAQNIGEARLNAFKNFIIRSHADAGLKIKDLTPEFLAAEFARFDPRYNLDYMKGLASKKAASGKEESGMFAEGAGIRTQAEPLDEQQKHMDDLL